MSYLFIQPISNNINTTTKIIFGKNISKIKIFEFVKKDVELKESCGMISSMEAEEIIKQTKEVLKDGIQEV